jgi:hypothetical protein
MSLRTCAIRLRFVGWIPIIVAVCFAQALFLRWQFVTSPIIYSHRGGVWGGVKENTLDAFRMSIAEGVWNIELDVQITSDGLPVVHHDNTWLGKPICEYDSYNITKDSEIPLLSEAFEATYGAHYLLDLKRNSLCTQDARAANISEVFQITMGVIDQSSATNDSSKIHISMAMDDETPDHEFVRLSESARRRGNSAFLIGNHEFTGQSSACKTRFINFVLSHDHMFDGSRGSKVAEGRPGSFVLRRGQCPSVAACNFETSKDDDNLAHGVVLFGATIVCGLGHLHMVGYSI